MFGSTIGSFASTILICVLRAETWDPLSMTIAPGQKKLLSTLWTARNRFEYLTENDWALIIDRAKRATFK
jgi:hypothetical protein